MIADLRLHCRVASFLLLVTFGVLFAVSEPASGAPAASLTVSWEDSATDYAAFVLERKIGLLGTYALLAPLAPAVLTYVDSAVTPGLTYCYRVAATNEAGASPYSNEACATAVSPATKTLTVLATGNGLVVSSPNGISCSPVCAATYPGGTTLVLSATPGGGSLFSGWGGDCSGMGPCTLVLDAGKTVTAAFTLQTFGVTVTKGGTGSGTVTSTPGGIACGSTCTTSIPSGTTLTLVAAPAAGSVFSGWTGPCAGTGSCTVTVAHATTLQATFAAASVSYGLTVAKTGTGTGTVKSLPEGIACGSTCKATFSQGTVLTLTAAPASGSAFSGWSGACSGTGTCTLTLNRAKSVTATFTRRRR